jgi:hypothetical protein
MRAVRMWCSLSIGGFVRIVVRNKKRSNAVEIAEHQLQHIFDSVKTMLDQFASVGVSRDVSLAYEAGLTSGFYGRRSFVAESSRLRMVVRYRELKRDVEDCSYRGFLRQIRRIGAAHGALIWALPWDNAGGRPKVLD